MSVQKYDRLLTEQSISGLNDDEMFNEILKEVPMPEDIKDATSKHVLQRACRVEAKRVQSQHKMT